MYTRWEPVGAATVLQLVGMEPSASNVQRMGQPLSVKLMPVSQVFTKQARQLRMPEHDSAAWVSKELRCLLLKAT